MLLYKGGNFLRICELSEKLPNVKRVRQILTLLNVARRFAIALYRYSGFTSVC